MLETRHYLIQFIRPEQNLAVLGEKIDQAHFTNPFGLAIDLTRGNIASRVDLLGAQIPMWSDFSISRVRQATKAELPTSGHLVSHSIDEIRAALQDENIENILVLDDTSFSGTTSLIIEKLVRSAFPDKNISFTHGFLILNGGELGPNPGAKRRLKSSGSQTLSGLEMNTPTDDGWHFFDIVKQQDLPEHLLAVLELLVLIERPDFARVSTELLADEKMLRLIFPNLLSADALEAERKMGHFIMAQSLNGDFHVRNPQLLPNIVGQGHLLSPDQWRSTPEQTLQLLIELSQLVNGEQK